MQNVEFTDSSLMPKVLQRDCLSTRLRPWVPKAVLYTDGHMVQLLHLVTGRTQLPGSGSTEHSHRNSSESEGTQGTPGDSQAEPSSQISGSGSCTVVLEIFS